jgi:thrombospondin type 3 repeat protein
VSADSVRGPKPATGPRIFQNLAADYETLSHDQDIPLCAGTSLVNSQSVAANVAATARSISPNPPPESGQVSQLIAPSPQGALNTLVLDLALPNQTKTHSIIVPAGSPDSTFGLIWLDAAVEPALGFTLLKPNGQQVDGSSPGVLGSFSLAGDSIYNSLMAGFTIDTPQQGTWQVQVNGISVRAEGTAYAVVLIPETLVSLGAVFEDDVVSQGASVVMRASLFDADVAIVATSMSASILAPSGAVIALTLNDGGTGGDDLAGDKIYSGTFAQTADCGNYTVEVTGSGSTSEGSVSRKQITTFEARVPGDAVRNPCVSDEDADGLTDDAEISVHNTDPLDRDMDDDGASDGAEITAGSDPLIVDTDSDGCADGEELGADKLFGGQRDPTSPWDFYDVNGTQKVDAVDIGLVRQNFNGTGPTPPEDMIYDRRTGANLWAPGPPDNVINAVDIGLVRASYNHNCQAAP